MARAQGLASDQHPESFTRRRKEDVGCFFLFYSVSICGHFCLSTCSTPCFFFIDLQFYVASKFTVSVLHLLSTCSFLPSKIMFAQFFHCGRVVYGPGIILYPCSHHPVPVTLPRSSSSAVRLCLCSSRKCLCAGVIDTSLFTYNCVSCYY